jgi:hypothetical protein
MRLFLQDSFIVPESKALSRHARICVFQNQLWEPRLDSFDLHFFGFKIED